MSTDPSQPSPNRSWTDDFRPDRVALGLSGGMRLLVAVTLVSHDVNGVGGLATDLRSTLTALGVASEQLVELGAGAWDFIARSDDIHAVHVVAKQQLADLPIDFCVQPALHRRKRLLIADMDSTIIGCECLDELADFAGVKAEVSAITERAMRGEIGFEGALRERVGMLKGLPIRALEQCYAERVRLNPGARTLVTTMALHGARCALVSGGFSFFTSRVAAAAGFHTDRANTLIVRDGALTGEVGDPILGREAKLAALNEDAAALGIGLAETLAIGDGANDLAMINAAGLGVAYRAKPLVAAEADARIDHSDLTALLYFQGYPADQFAKDGD